MARVQLVSNVIGCPWQEVKVGMAVKAVFEDVTPEVTLAKFKPAYQERSRSILPRDMNQQVFPWR